ncbi:hypothetical protein SDC9_95562 [bioreactor metagenome]|uniref:Uncharacterized protein n=1 Tax=bioreactor metagenome TaxID=1076179 RepID=A0A645A6N2_9ZZZZ
MHEQAVHRDHQQHGKHAHEAQHDAHGDRERRIQTAHHCQRNADIRREVGVPRHGTAGRDETDKDGLHRGAHEDARGDVAEDDADDKPGNQRAAQRIPPAERQPRRVDAGKVPEHRDEDSLKQRHALCLLNLRIFWGAAPNPAQGHAPMNLSIKGGVPKGVNTPLAGARGRSLRKAQD